MVNLNIDNIQQTEEFPCGPNSLFMVSKYFKKNLSKQEILKKFKEKTDNINRVIMPVIAEVALEVGLKPYLIITNYTYFPEKLNRMDKRELLKYIEAKINSNEDFINKEDKEYYSSLRRFIEKGGKVEFRLFTQKDIESSLLNKKPCICQINSASFSKIDIDYKRQHFIVVRGFDENNFIINIGHEEPRKKDKEDLLFSLYRTKIPNLLLF